MERPEIIFLTLTAVVTLLLAFNPFRRPPTPPKARRRRGGQP
jgi:hypothetical protein